MGSKAYYASSVKFPPVIKAIIQSLEYHVGTLLYPGEDYYTEVINKRILFSDFVGAGFDEAGRKSIENNNDNQAHLPYTAYWIDDDAILDEYKSYPAANGSYFSDAFNAYVSVIPIDLTFPMVSVFATPQDYWRARQLLEQDAAFATKLTVPCTINNILTSFDCDLGIDVNKGDYAFAFEDHRTYGKIYDISHTMNVRGFYVQLSGTTIPDPDNPGEFLITNPYPVDDIILAFNELNETLEIGQATLKYTETEYDTPVVTSSVTEDATDVSKTDSILINFTVGMEEITVETNIDIVPAVNSRYSWDDTSKIMTILFVDPLEAETEYNITVNTGATSYVDIPIAEDFELNFTTAV